MAENFTPTKLALQLAENLQNANVRFTTFKSNIHLDKALAGKTDLDLLVHKKDANRFQMVVSELGFQHMLSPVWSSYPGIEDWVGLDYGSGQIHHLHVHYSLLTGRKTVKHLNIPWEDMVFHHLTFDPTIHWPVPKPEAELAILFVRLWAKESLVGRIRFLATRRFIIPKDMEHELLSLLQESDMKELVYILREETNLAIGPEDEILLEKIKKEGDFAAVGHISRTVNQQLHNHWRAGKTLVFITGLKNRTTLFVENICAVLGIPVQRQKTISKGGVIISFIGSDGAGKSTLSHDITSWLQYKIDAHWFYLGSGTSLPKMVEMTLDVYEKSTGVFVKITSKNRSINAFFRKVQKLSFLYIARRNLHIIRKARRLCIDGSIIITDRFPQIQQQHMNDGPKLQNGECFGWAARNEMSLLKQCTDLGPDMVIRLNVSPGIAHQRKPETSLLTIEEKIRRIGDLSFPQADIVDIDANGQYEKVLLDVKSSIWNNL
jgi:thymidylate kinase